MSRFDDRELARQLTPTHRPEPPAGLLEKIKADIPSELPAPQLARVTPFRPRVPRRWMAIAATMVAVVGGGYLAWRVEEGRQLTADRRQTEAAVAAIPAGVGTKARETAGPHLSEPVDESSSRSEQDALAGSADSTVAAAAPVARETGKVPVSAAPGAREKRAAQPASPAPRKSFDQELAAPGYRADKAREAGSVSPPAPSPPTPLKRSDAKGPLRGRASNAPEPASELSQSEEINIVSEAPVIEVTSTALGSKQQPAVGDDRRGETEIVERRPMRRSGEELGVARSSESERPRGEHVTPPAGVAGTTGGTAEPNDAPYGDVFFRHYGVNPFVDTEDDPLSTFQLDVDTGSYAVLRNYLRSGHLPPPEAVRVEEVVNYFDYRDPAPRGGDFALRAEGAPSPWAPGERYALLRFSLRARELPRGERRPANLTFVVDTSGSMARDGRLGLVVEALELLLDELRPGDRVALVTYGDRARLELRPTADRAAVRRALRDLVPAGSTNAEDGLALAYEVAADAFDRRAANRVILCSDGVANVGATGPQSIFERVRREAERGIELTAVGVGLGNYNDVLLEQLADRANGRYAYVDTLAEARKLFVDELSGTLHTLAHDARAQVTFDPAVVERWRLLGYENRDLADHRFRDDSADAGEIGYGHAVTVLYEVKLSRDPMRSDPLATLRLRYRPTGERRFVEAGETLRFGDLSRSFDRAPASLQLAAVAARLAEILRGSYWARGGDLGELLSRTQLLQPRFAGDPEVAELAALVATAARLAPPHREEGEDRSGGEPDR